MYTTTLLLSIGSSCCYNFGLLLRHQSLLDGYATFFARLICNIFMLQLHIFEQETVEYKELMHVPAGQNQDQNDPTAAALNPNLRSCGSPTPGTPNTPAESFSSPVVSLPGSLANPLSSSHDSALSKQFPPVEAVADPKAAGKEVDLLTDPSDVLMLSSDDGQDNHAGCDDLFLGTRHDLPDDPLEGLCIPSWQDLLDEAVSEFNPRAGPPGDAGVMPHAYQGAAEESSQGCSWDFSALSEGPVPKRHKPESAGTTQGSSTLLSWELQDQFEIFSTDPESSPAWNMGGPCSLGKSEFATHDQAGTHTSSCKRGTRSDKLNQEAQQMMMMEISSAVNGAQQAQQQPKPAAVQKRRLGSAKRAKRAVVSCKGQGKRTAASQLQGKDSTSTGQGRGQGQGQRLQGASLGKLLPFDSLKVSVSAFSSNG